MVWFPIGIGRTFAPGLPLSSTAPPDTPRLRFEWWQADDLGHALTLWGSPEVSRFISSGGFSRSDIEARLARELANGADHGVQYWRLLLRETGEFIGCCGLKPFDPGPQVFELGFQLLPQFWGKGYAREASRAAIGFAFGRLNASALVAGHHPENLPSQRTLEALGFRYTHDVHYPPTGLMHRLYRLDRPPPDMP